MPERCSECDLALDVFQQLLAEGCAPNLVTFNILIDIHGKSGQWSKAVEVLDQLHQQVGWRLDFWLAATLFMSICMFQALCVG